MIIQHHYLHTPHALGGVRPQSRPVLMYSTVPGIQCCTGTCTVLYSTGYRYRTVPVKRHWGEPGHTRDTNGTRGRTGTCMSRLPPCLFTGTVSFRQTSKIASSQRARCVLFLFSKLCSKPSLPCFEGDVNAHDGALPLRYRTLTGSKTPGERGNRGAGTFGIEFGYICYQDTYPDVSCVYPEGYMYPDVS